MNVHGLDKLLNPQRIALVGVTINPNSVGGKVLHNLVGSAFRGVVYPVNPVSEAIMGVPCYSDLESVPRTPDLVIVCTPAEKVVGVMEKAGRMGVEGAIVMSAGFQESGPEGSRLSNDLKTVLSKYPRLRMIGPNCLGIVVPGLNLNASFSQGMPSGGHVAFISQSGALCTSVLDWARDRSVGFSYFVSVGNALDVDFADLIDYFGEDEKTESIVLYIESVSDARRFMTAARAFARTKPIVVYKAGRYPQSAAVAASHTGAMASEDSVYDAAFRRAGIARVLNIGEIFSCVELIGRSRFPEGPRLGIVTNAGGPGVMAVDKLIQLNGQLAELSADSVKELDGVLPPIWSGRNPVDVLGDANAKRFEKASRIVLGDKEVDALLVILTPQAMTKPDRTALKIASVSKESGKPVLAAWLGGESVRKGREILDGSDVAVYSTPEQAVSAFMTLVDYADNLEDLYETPRDIIVDFAQDQMQMRNEARRSMPDEKGFLSEQKTKELLQMYGIRATIPKLASNPGEAAEIAEEIGYPVAMKVQSPQIVHKSDSGGVALNVECRETLERSWGDIMKSTSACCPQAEIDGITVQKMAPLNGGVEMILGARRDTVFGAVIMAGKGGVETEVWKDTALGLPPLNEHLAARMLQNLRITPLLKGFRGSKPVNMEELINVMMRFSYMVCDNPEFLEIEVNPLLCTSEGIIALDARALVDPALELDRNYSHLALRPYPAEYIRPSRLEDGTEILLRPIKPEDEPMWMEMLGNCSRESIYSRFGFFYNWANHQAASRYCYIDHDRGIAIVAEHRAEKGRSIHAIGRLIADPDLKTVEYAILVDDQWQNRGLGKMVTEYCERIAVAWGIGSIVAHTNVSNRRMVHLFESLGYSISHDKAGGEVFVQKKLKGL